jgi:hypothetical protein
VRLLTKLRAYATLRARRNYFDFMRYLVRRPALLVAVQTYETAVILSNRVEGRYKQLACIKASSLIGCPF